MLRNKFSIKYIDLCFSIWYTNNKPSMAALATMIDPDEEGHTPEASTLSHWRALHAWDTRAENTDIEVSKHTDRQLVKTRMEMMTRHAEMAKEIAERAYNHLVDVGFDSSTSAVNALFKAVEEEKRSRDMEVALTQVFSLNDDELQKTMNKLLSRARGLGDGIIEAEVSDAPSATETPDE